MAGLINYCEVCGKQFIPYRSWHKRCSDKCRFIATEKEQRYIKKAIIEKVCKQCGDKFETNNKKKEYCCPHCQEIHRASSYKPKEVRETICKQCGQAFETTHHAKSYCGDDCYREAKKIRQKRGA